MLRGASLGGGAAEAASRSGKPAQAGRNRHRGCGGWTKRGSPRLTASARERAWGAEEKEGGRGLRPCEDRRARVWLPARRNAVAEVGKRRQVSN